MYISNDTPFFNGIKIPFSLFQLVYDTSNGMIGDQDYNTAQGESDLIVNN